MANHGEEKLNRLALIARLEKSYSEGRLFKGTSEDGEQVYIEINENHDILAGIKVSTGEWMYSNAGKKKSNNRAYINIPIFKNPDYMCANYTFRVIAEGLISDKEVHKERYKKFKEGIYVYKKLTPAEARKAGHSISKEEKCIFVPTYEWSVINHINGDTSDNSDGNLEVVTHGMNTVHARLMSEIACYFPHLMHTAYDCQGHAMHSWVDCIGVTCDKLQEWNKHNPTQAIKAWKNVKGYRPHLSEHQVRYIMRFIGKEV